MKHTSDKKPVWIDCDPAFGDENGDCDDGYAIIALMNAENVDVRGASSVFGNTGVDNAHAKITYLVDTFYPGKLNVFHGDDWPIQLNHHKKSADSVAIRSSSASKELIKELESLRDEGGPKLTVVAIGSLVNIATVALTRCDLLEHVEQVVIVAGRYGTNDTFVFGNDSTRVFRDLNFDVDPMACIALLSSRVAVTLAGVQVARSMWFNEDDLNEFKDQSGSPVAYMAEQSEGWLNVWRQLDKPDGPSKIEGFHPFDLFAAAWVIEPKWFKGSARTATIRAARDDTIVNGHDRMNYKLYLVADRDTETGSSFDREEICSPWRVYFLTDTTPRFKDGIKRILMMRD